VIGSRKPGGAENFFLRLHAALNRADIPSWAVLPAASELNAQLQGPVQHARLASVRDPLSRWSVSRALKAIKPDIVQTWMGRATRLVHTGRGRGPVHVARLGGYYDAVHYRHVDALVGNTRGICDYLIREGFAPERVFHISNFVAFEAPQDPAEARRAIREQLGLEPEAKLIFSLGRLHVNKAFDTLISAFNQLHGHAQGEDMHLVIAGDGPLREEIATLVAQTELAERIHLVGWQQETGRWFAAADLFVCPSRHEPLGNVILEAWAHRLPVISTASDGACELIDEGVNGLLCPIDDIAAMAQRLEAWCNGDRESYRALGEAGAEKLERAYSERVIVEQYRQLYDSLLTRQY
jgi:glycosyltransferase involved in cell wall biosynthesis